MLRPRAGYSSCFTYISFAGTLRSRSVWSCQPLKLFFATKTCRAERVQGLLSIIQDVTVTRKT